MESDAVKDAYLIEGASQAELVRRWKIVDALIEEYDELVASVKAGRRLLKEAAAQELWWSVEAHGRVLVRDRARLADLRGMLLEGSDGGDF